MCRLLKRCSDSGEKHCVSQSPLPADALPGKGLSLLRPVCEAESSSPSFLVIFSGPLSRALQKSESCHDQNLKTL